MRRGDNGAAVGVHCYVVDGDGVCDAVDGFAVDVLYFILQILCEVPPTPNWRNSWALLVLGSQLFPKHWMPRRESLLPTCPGEVPGGPSWSRRGILWGRLGPSGLAQEAKLIEHLHDF